MNWYKKARTNILDCDDCGKTTLSENYMLKEEIWNTVADRNTNLCIDCLEKRLGRKLVQFDFQPIAFNFWPSMYKFKNHKLLNRLGIN